MERRPVKWKWPVLSALLALSTIVPLRASATDTAVLKRITSRVDDRAGVISIEASDPVPYVASQPDPRTFVIEMRDVLAVGFADNFKIDPRVPIAGVHVENTRAFDGASVARVSVDLAQPIRPRVRSSRNVIYVEADRLDRVAAGVISASGPSSVIRDMRVERRGASTAITLQATGKLVPTSVEATKEGPARLYVDLANASSSLPGVTPVGQGAVQNVRIGLNEKSPMLTRVAVEMTRRSAYHLEPSTDGQQLTVIIDDGAAPSTQAQAAAVLAPPPAAAPLAPKPAALMAQAQAPPASIFAPPPAQAPPPQTTPQTPPAGAQVPQTAAPSRYTGNSVSLDFQGADLRAVLRTFAEISGLNIVIDPTIQGTVDVSLRDVPWDQALDIILRANKLGYVVDGTIVRVAPLTVLADEETQRRKLSDEQALSGELRVLTRSLSYARAEDLRPLLTATVLSSRGSIQTDPRTNTLIINDLPDRLQRANDLLTTLDQPQPQVEIEARIVQTTRQFARTIGVQWGIGGRMSNSIGNTTGLAFPNQGSITGRTGGVQGPPAPEPAFDSAATGVNLGVTGASTAVGLAMGSVNGALNLDVILSALERQGQGRLLSTPRVTTQNNVEAEMTQGVQIPIQTVANNTVTVTFKDAALTLKVTPQITAANTVIMRVSLENASPDYSKSVNNIPPIDTQRAITQVLVNNGDTTVIGGIYVSSEQTNKDGTPGLSRLPLLGWLFQRNGVNDESRELLIFITPRILTL
ncbi:MAG TPA: type IV pilus secretin PilQ [Vicinamibacterales bacterium]|jgi:type IV pilus assembly protein PilQ